MLFAALLQLDPAQMARDIERAGMKLMLYVELFLLQVLQVVEELARVVFQVVFGQGFPKKILDVLERLCGWANTIIEHLIGTAPDSGVLCSAFNWLGGAFDDIAGLVQTIMDVEIAGWKPFQHVLAEFHKAFSVMAHFFLTALPCSDDALIACDFAMDAVEVDPEGTLPVATRCFSTYTTFFGEGQQLSCSPADTCNVHLAGIGGELAVCGSCATGRSETAGLSTRFGCSAITKICTCNVPVLVETLCHANADCYGEERTCRFLDSDFARGFGAAPCATCETSKMCFLEAGRTAGYCACGLGPITFASCPRGETSSNRRIRVDDMCLLTSDPQVRHSRCAQARLFPKAGPGVQNTRFWGGAGLRRLKAAPGEQKHAVLGRCRLAPPESSRATRCTPAPPKSAKTRGFGPVHACAA